MSQIIVKMIWYSIFFYSVSSQILLLHYCCIFTRGPVWIHWIVPVRQNISFYPCLPSSLTLGQVAPGWCLLSSACQFGNGIPKSHLPCICVPEQEHQKLTKVLAFPEYLSHFHPSHSHFLPFPSHFQPLTATSSHAWPCKAFCSYLMAHFKKIQPFTALFWTFPVIPEAFSNI